MAMLGALEGIKSGTTTLVENSPGIGVYAQELAKTGLRWVWAESGRDAVTPPGWRSAEHRLINERSLFHYDPLMPLDTPVSILARAHPKLYLHFRGAGFFLA